MPKLIDLNGRRCGRLVVVSSGLSKSCNCVCDCGAAKTVERRDILRSAVRSCGCFRDERRKINPVKHGMAGTPEYRAFRNAKNRCERAADPRFEHYGGRGIKMMFLCFEDFFKALGPRPSDRHSLDRIDNDGHYEAGNVRWTELSNQANNNQRNITITIGRTSNSLTSWCRKLGQPYDRIWQRIAVLNWDPLTALTTGLRPDALAEALGVDDGAWLRLIQERGERSKTGGVIIEVEAE